jgi:hypothetical protein
MIIRPYQGVGPIDFGMTIEQVRRSVGATVESFYKTVDSAFPTDAFDSLGMHVYYRLPGCCDAVELFQPAAPILEGEALIGRPYNELREFLSLLDPGLKIDASGLVSGRFGVSIYAPFGLDYPGEPVEAVLVFERGYYKGV